MRWKVARVKLLEMLDHYSEDWSEEYKQAVKIGIDRIAEVEDLEDLDEEQEAL